MNRTCPRCHKKARCYWHEENDGKRWYDEYTLYCPFCMYLEVSVVKAGLITKTGKRNIFTICPYCQEVCRQHVSEMPKIIILKRKYGGGDKMSYIFKAEIDFIAANNGFLIEPKNGERFEKFETDIRVSSVHEATTTAIEKLEEHVREKYGLGAEIFARIIREIQPKKEAPMDEKAIG